MKKTASIGLTLVLIVSICFSSFSFQSSASITIQVNETLGVIDPTIYGHFTELTLSSFEGAIWSEQVFNRKFEAPEERDINQIIFSGTAAGWEPIAIDTRVSLVRDTQVYYSPSSSQRITLTDVSNVPAGVQQSGYQFVMPHLSRNQRVENPFRFEPGERYLVRLAIKRKNGQGPVQVALGGSYKQTTAKISLSLKPGNEWNIYSGELRPTQLVEKGKLMIFIDTPGTVWIDSVSMLRADLNEDGFRKDALELSRKVTPTLIRWPGGWFASDYHWQDAIGPIDRRPAIFSRPWNAYVSNDVGTDEFLLLCKKLGADPYLTVNVGTGTPEEAAKWVEYVNGSPSTQMGKLRSRNGHPQPYGVKYWNVGNEEYLPTLGGTDGKQYGRNFNEFARAMKAVDPTIKLVAVGASDIPKGVIPPDHPLWKIVRYLPDWNAEVLKEAGPQIDYYSLHYYAPENVAGHTADEVNQATMVIAEDLQRKVDKLWGQMKQFAPNGRRYPIAFDEWSLKVDNEATPPKPPVSNVELAQLGLHMGALSLRNALSEATIYNLMQRYPGDFVLGSRSLIYAYLVGLIAIRRDRALATPGALMMQLYSTREKCQALKSQAESGTFSTKTMQPGFPEVKNAKYLDVSSRLHPDGKTIDVFVVNRNLSEAITSTVNLVGADLDPNVEIDILTAPDLNTFNTFAEPNNVVIERKQASLTSGSFNYSFPAHSLVKIIARRK